MIINAALKEDLSLEYDGKPVATVHKAGYATPNYSAKCDFLDQKTADQMLKARQYDIWRESATGSSATDEQAAAKMNEIGLEKQYYDMRHSYTWATKDYKGVVTAIDIVDMDNTGLEWRPGKVIFRPKTRLPHWMHVILNVIYFIIFLVVLGIIHRAIS